MEKVNKEIDQELTSKTEKTKEFWRSEFRLYCLRTASEIQIQRGESK